QSRQTKTHMVTHAEEPASTTQGTNDSGLTPLPERRPDPAVLDQRYIFTTHRLFASGFLASTLRSWDGLAAAHCWKKLTTHRHSSKKALKVLRSVGSRRLIDYLPRNKRGCIIFTTRDRKAAVKLAQQNIITVPEMSEEAAIELLQKCLASPNLVDNTQDATALLESLTYLPLAITQAAAYINENGVTLSEYVLLLGETEEETIELLSEEFQDYGRYRDVKNPVATTWLISFEQIRRSDPLAAEYLSFIACVNPRDIPESLLPPGPSRNQEMKAVGTLAAYSFISRRPVDSSLDLHRLVHLATRNWLRKEGLLSQWTRKTIIRLEEVFPDDDHNNRSLWRTYLPHAGQVLASDLVSEDGEHRMTLLRKYGRCLHSDGRWDEAEATFAEVVTIDRKTLGEESSFTLSSVAWLASTYMKQGRWEEAEQLEVQVMETSKTKLGADHPDTLTSMANLASTYSNQGRWEEAEQLQVQVMETSKTKLGADHPHTLTSMNNLAFTWKGLGRDTEAIQQMKDCVQRRTRILGAKHPDSLSSKEALTEWEAERLDISVDAATREDMT
ncbi:hypothetical protein LTR70_010244, partial [Exophiala xenobiotica]